MPDLRARIGLFLDMESRRRLFDFQVDGWSIWRIIRQPIHRAAMDYPIFGMAVSRPNKTRFILKSLRLLYFIVFGPKVDLFVKTTYADLRAYINGKRADIFFDAILPSWRYFKVENQNGAEIAGRSQLACPAHLSADVFDLWGRILGRLAPLEAAYPALDEIRDVVSSEMQLEVDVNDLRRAVSAVFWKIRLYSLLLKRMRPRLVLVSDSGEYPLLLAAAKLGVRSLEVQHGFTYGGHPEVIPLSAALPREALAVPDVLAARGDFWIDRLKGSYQGESAVAVGIQGMDEARSLRESLKDQDRPFTIVLTSQGMDTERLVAWVEEMVQTAPPALSWCLVVKPHPLYDRGNVALNSLARNDRVFMSDGPDAPTALELLSAADLHISIASTCLFDAAALGVRSVIIPLGGHEDVVECVDNVGLFLAAKPADIWAHTGAIFPSNERDRYSEPAYMDNMRKLITRMTQSGARDAL